MLHAVQLDEYDACEAVTPSDMAAWTLVGAQHGICMQYHSTAHKNCELDEDFNLPAYTVQAETAADVQKALQFATTHDIPVSVKSTGHSYSGSSTMAGTLMVWMHKFEKYGFVGSHTDTCGTTTEESIKLGGGQSWYDAYGAVAGTHNLVGGGGKTVGCCGGWLNGGGLSAMSRLYGLGIDNVVQFEAFLGNGTAVVADACSHPDLFWALRGGGGGSFAVVTAVHYRLHKVTPAVELLVVVDLSDVDTNPKVAEAVRAYYHKWVDVTVAGLDQRWGGYWQLSAGLGVLYFMGSEADARATLIDDLESWKAGLPPDVAQLMTFIVNNKPQGYTANRASSQSTDVTGYPSFPVGSRLIPESFVTANEGADAKAMLDTLLAEGKVEFTAYQLGGQVHEVAPNATAISPVMRSATWSIISYRDGAVKYLQENVPGSAPCYNHHQANEPGDWAEAFWGSNLPRLNAVKAAYDPEGRLNCWHCVGFREYDAGIYQPVPLSGSSSKGEVAASCFVPLVTTVLALMIFLLPRLE